MARYLVSVGADKNYKYKVWTPVFILEYTIYAHCEMAQNEFVPLYIAAQNGHFEVVKYLIGAGADYTITTKVWIAI